MASLAVWRFRRSVARTFHSSGANARQKYGELPNRPRLGVHQVGEGLRPAGSVAAIWRRVGRVSGAKIIKILVNEFGREDRPEIYTQPLGVSVN